MYSTVTGSLDGLLSLAVMRGSRAFGELVVDGGKANGQGLDGRHAVDHGVINIIGLRRGSGDRAQCPAMDLGQAEAIVGGAVADLFAVHAGEGDLISFQPLKLSGKSIDQRSASSLVEPGLRLSSTSTNMVVPLLLPYSQKEIPS